MNKIIRSTLLMVWLPALLVVVWWVATASSTNLYIPPLETILRAFVRDWFGPNLISDGLPSIAKFAAGFLIASVTGIVLGLLIGLSPTLSAALDPLIQFFRAIPPPALLPVALLVVGIGPGMSIAVIAIGAVWPTLLNTIDGVRAVDPQVRDMAASYRLPLGTRIVKVVLPAASPQIFAGLRVSLQLSIILIVVAEMFASTSGIGFYVLYSQQTFGIPETWAGTLVLGLLGYLATLLFVLVERRVLGWHRGMTDSLEKA